MGASDTHSIWVRTKPKNIKMILDFIDIQIYKLDNPIKDYKHCLKNITYENHVVDFHLNEYDKCLSILLFQVYATSWKF